MRISPPIFATAIFLCALMGCAGNTTVVSGNPPPPSNSSTVAGKVQGGQLARVGASVQLYAAGETGNGSTPTLLSTNAITTDANGAFSVTYSCPSTADTLYVVAKGGRLASATSMNANAWLMTAVGSCSTTAATNTSIVVNEVTTVASVWALSQFLSSSGNVGASSTNSQGLANAVVTAGNLVDFTAGVSPGAGLPSNVTVATSKLNTLANALTPCVISDGSACGPLFTASTVGGVPPANTLDVAFNIVRNPAANVAAIYTAAGVAPVFSPALSSAPPDWLLSSTLTGGGLSDPASVAVDGAGNVWVSNYDDSLSEFFPSGATAFSSGLRGYGINQSYGMALDAQDNVWIANEQTSMNAGNGDVTKLNSSGASLSGATGFTAGGISFPKAIAADTTGNIWVANYGNSSVTLLNSSGIPLSGGGFGDGFVEFPLSIAVDSNHNAWIGNENAGFITRISSDGSQVLNVNCCDSAAGIAIDQGNNVWTANYVGANVSLITNSSSASPGVNLFTGGGLVAPNGIAIDGSGTAWVVDYRADSLVALAGVDATSPGTFLAPNGFGLDASLDEPYAVAIDASGNIWVSNAGSDTVTEFIGAATPVKTPMVGPPTAP